MTISEGLSYMKVLMRRHSELVELRSDNSKRQRRYFGNDKDNFTIEEPVYDIKAIDKKIAKLGAEMRKLDAAIKTANATVAISYTADDSALDAIE
jgi:hypothetical protein